MSKKIQLELQNIFKTKVRLYLDYWDSLDKYVYKYKFKINNIYISVHLDCDEMNTAPFNIIMQGLLIQVHEQIMKFY